MTEKEMWQAFILEKPRHKDKSYEAWCYGSDTPDLLADLTAAGTKTATASAFDVYEYEKNELPKPGNYSIILNSMGAAVCIIRTINVAVVPFLHVSAEHAFKEGEGDRSLNFWREVHAKFFTAELTAINEKFSEDMLVLCEEFELVFPEK